MGFGPRFYQTRADGCTHALTVLGHGRLRASPEPTYLWGMAPHVVIVGGGFGGLHAAKALRYAPVEVTLLDRNNYHLFQPLLYQVAMSGLGTTEIATPIRSVLGKYPNISVLLEEVTAVDLEGRRVLLAGHEAIPYDYLILAAGAKTNYFGHPEWSRHALGLKDLDDAIEIRRRVLLAYEAAEREPNEAARRRLLSFVVIGAGPTGIELAGALSELARFVLARDYRRARPEESRILVLEAADRCLLGFDERLSRMACRHLRHMGVQLRFNAQVTNVDERGVWIGDELVEASTVLWTAGVAPQNLAATLDVEKDRKGRIVVAPDCSIPGHPEVFAIGDIAHFRGEDGKPLPGLAPVAMQQGRAVANNIVRSVRGERRLPFRYRDKGMMATVGRSRAVVQFGRLRFDGLPAWLTWVGVHIFYLIGFRNRLLVLADWFYAYATYRRGARLITGRRLRPGAPRRLVEPSEVERDASRRRAEARPTPDGGAGAPEPAPPQAP